MQRIKMVGINYRYQRVARFKSAKSGPDDARPRSRPFAEELSPASEPLLNQTPGNYKHWSDQRDITVTTNSKPSSETAKLPITTELPAAIITPEFLFELGDAVVVDVKPESSTLLATSSRSAFLSGDYAAIRK